MDFLVSTSPIISTVFFNGVYHDKLNPLLDIKAMQSYQLAES